MGGGPHESPGEVTLANASAVSHVVRAEEWSRPAKAAATGIGRNSKGRKRLVGAHRPPSRGSGVGEPCSTYAAHYHSLRTARNRQQVLVR